MCLGKKTENETSVFKNKIMKNNEEQKIFEITIDNTLYFKCPVNNLCYKSTPPKLGSSKTLKVPKWHEKELNNQIGSKISVYLLYNRMDVSLTAQHEGPSEATWKDPLDYIKWSN